MTQVQKSSLVLSQGIRGGHLGASGGVIWAQQPPDLTRGHAAAPSEHPALNLGRLSGAGDWLRGLFPAVREMFS